MKRRLLYFILSVTALVGCSSGAGNPASKGKGVLRILHYNVGVFSKSGYDSTEEIASIIKEYGADIVSVNELDSCNRRHGTFQLRELAEALGGWGYIYQKAIDYKDGAYGVGIVAAPGQLQGEGVTKEGEGFVRTDGHIMPNFGAREHRAFVIAETEKYVFVSTHLEVEKDYARVEQAKIINATLKELYGDSEKPVFLAGDMNDEMPSAVITELLKEWDLLSAYKNSFSADNPQICIDYVFSLRNKSKVKLVKADVIGSAECGDVTKASDHLPIYVDVKI